MATGTVKRALGGSSSNTFMVFFDIENNKIADLLDFVLLYLCFAGIPKIVKILVASPILI